MISCDKVKELLMSSYIDNELDENIVKQVRHHLNICADCRELESLLKKNIVTPLEKSRTMVPSDAVWNAIEAEIGGSVEQIPKDLETFWEKLRRAILRPLPVMSSAIAGLSLIILLGYNLYVRTAADNTDIYVENYFRKHIRFLDYLESDAGNYYTKGDYLGLMTPIEKYLF